MRLDGSSRGFRSFSTSRRQHRATHVHLGNQHGPAHEIHEHGSARGVRNTFESFEPFWKPSPWRYSDLDGQRPKLGGDDHYYQTGAYLLAVGCIRLTPNTACRLEAVLQAATCCLQRPSSSIECDCVAQPEEA